MFLQAFLQEIGSGHLRHEEQILRDSLTQIGIPVSFYTTKDVQRRRLPLSRDCFLSGDVEVVHSALRQLQIAEPELSDYPASLQKYLGREIRKTTLKALEVQLLEGRIAGIFAKPASRKKAF